LSESLTWKRSNINFNYNVATSISSVLNVAREIAILVTIYNSASVYAFDTIAIPKAMLDAFGSNSAPFRKNTIVGNITITYINGTLKLETSTGLGAMHLFYR
jgi:hypothetical protein